jgi:hypothetical protein
MLQALDGEPEENFMDLHATRKKQNGSHGGHGGHGLAEEAHFKTGIKTFH